MKVFELQGNKVLSLKFFELFIKYVCILIVFTWYWVCGGFLIKMRNQDLFVVLIYITEGATCSYFYTFQV